MDRPIIARRLRGIAPVGERKFRWRAVSLVLLCCLVLTAGLRSESSAQTPGARYPCSSWDGGMVNQGLKEIDSYLTTFWNDHENDYGPPEVLTDSHYTNNRSAYIYPNNLNGIIPTFEPPAAASDATKENARKANACIELDSTSGVPAPYNSFNRAGLMGKWKTLADSVPAGSFETRSLNMGEANRFHVNNNAYCTQTPRPADCVNPYRAGDISDAYKLFYDVAIYRSGDGDVRDATRAHSEDYFRIWSTPRQTNGAAMSFNQFGNPTTIPNNLQNRTGNNGTVVFSNTFEISEAQYNLYQTATSTATGALSIQGVADDYLGMWLNGRQVVSSVKSGNAFISIIDPTMLNPPVNGKSTNTIKAILFDKYVIRADRSDYQQMGARSMGSGLLYSMMYFPPKNAPASASCGPTTFPTTWPAGRAATFTVSGRINRPFTAPFVDDTNPTMAYTVTGPGGFRQAGNIGYTPVTRGGTATLTSNTITLPAVPASRLGNYVLTWTISSGNFSDPKTIDCGSNTMLVGNQPYFVTTGGDMWAGTNDNDAAGIRSWNEDSASYSGAGSQIAALATGKIQSFITGSGLAAGVGSGYGLSFANTPAPGGSGEYGGGFESMPQDLPGIPAGTGCPASLSCTIDPVTGDIRVAGGTLPNGVSEVISSDGGNVYINGNILFQNYGSVQQIPHLAIVGKNIYINSSVTEVHGNLWTSEEGVFTCNTYTYATSDFPGATGPPSQGDCNRPLKLYGTVRANKLYLLRTAGNWATNTDPAEEFVYSPELWLNRGGGSVQNIDSYISLPPIL